MKVSIVTGICVQHDAISNAVADRFGWLRDAGHEVRLYAMACDRPELQCHLAGRLQDVVFDPHFQHSDVVIFHFGIYYPLFDLIPVTPLRARRLVVFHNITPKSCVAEAHHEIIDRSFRQMANIAFADHVMCDSAVNLEVLRAARIETPSTVLPLAVHTAAQPVAAKPGVVDGIVRIAFVGRLVESKGPCDLLSALSMVLEHTPHAPRLALDIVANLAFSDPLMYDAVREAAEILPHRFGNRIAMRLHGDAPDALKQRILAEADLFVLPTRHEGFCVPIVEALGAGCRVITYDNSNTPAISGGHARLLPTGDVDALAGAIVEEAALVTAPAWQASGPGGYTHHAQQAWRYTQQYAPDAARQYFLELVVQSG